VVFIIFKYCDDKQLPLLDLKDIKKVNQLYYGRAKRRIAVHYTKISTSTTETILRKIIELGQQGGDIYFGEKSFEISDVMRIDENGNGCINILWLKEIQDKPKLLSTFILNLPAEMYQQISELGDLGQPELVLFIDEASLIFNKASKTLLDQIESIVKWIWSKGIGIYFIP
jgi:hypothetical protein